MAVLLKTQSCMLFVSREEKMQGIRALSWTPFYGLTTATAEEVYGFHLAPSQVVKSTIQLYEDRRALCDQL